VLRAPVSFDPENGRNYRSITHACLRPPFLAFLIWVSIDFASRLAYSLLPVILDRSSSSGPSGLIPYGDYVVGWTEGALHAESDFYDLVEHVSSLDSLHRISSGGTLLQEG
jgi:hypothetical protein